MKKAIYILSVIGLFICSFFIVGNISAEVIINSIKLNGVDNASVAAGTAVNATINVQLTSPNVWGSTAYKFGGEDWACVDTPNHSTDTIATETFMINVPTEQGTSNVDFKVYGNNNCTDGLSVASLSANLLTPVIAVFSTVTGRMWLLIMPTLLVIVFIGFFIIYIIKIIANRKIKLNDKK